MPSTILTSTDLPNFDECMNQGNIPHLLGLTNPEHTAGYNYLNERILVATRYYHEELLGYLGLSDDIRWLFAWGS